MTAALWIIAACMVIRVIQNSFQLVALFGSKRSTEKVQEQFIDNLVKTDKTFAKNFADEIERRYSSESSNT